MYKSKGTKQQCIGDTSNIQTTMPAVRCSKRWKRECLAARRSCTWKIGKGCRINRSIAGGRTRVVCYCLFGSNIEATAVGHDGMSHKIKLYLLGLDCNMRRIPKEFAVIAYISRSIWDGAQTVLEKMVSVYTPRLLISVVECRHSLVGNYSGTLWRFLPLFDRRWRVVLVRDLDDMFTMSPALKVWMHAPRMPLFHRQIVYPGTAEIRDTDSKHVRVPGDEYAWSAGWIGRRNNKGAFCGMDKALQSMRRHLQRDKGYCTDERWLLKAAGEGLFGFKQTWPWHSTVHKISEISARLDLPFENDEDAAWIALLRRYKTLVVDRISVSHCVTHMNDPFY